MDLKEYFSVQEEKDNLQNNMPHPPLSPWLLSLEKSVYAFIRFVRGLCWPFIKIFEKLADLIKHHASYKQGNLFTAPSFLAIQSKRLKKILEELFKKTLKSFDYCKEHFEGPTLTFVHDWVIALLSVPITLFIVGNYSFKDYTGSFVIYESILFTLSTLGVFFLIGLYEAKYRPLVLPDLIEHLQVVLLSIGLYIPLYVLTGASAKFPDSFLVILGLIFFSGLLLPRLLYVVWKEKNFSILQFHNISSLPVSTHKVEKASHQKSILIIGSTSETIEAYTTLNKENSPYRILGIVQEKPIFEENSKDTSIKVLGRLKEFELILDSLAQHKIMPEEIWIAEYHPSAKILSHVLSISNKYPIPVKKLISLSSSHGGVAPKGAYRPLVLEDFFPSFSPVFDKELLKDFVEGARFLITGAAGSLGTTLAQKIALLRPQHITLIDHAEGNLFKLELDLAKKFPNLSYASYLCDVTECSPLSQIIEVERPDYIFHLAAVKQVGLAEKNPNQTVYTNIIGLKNIADLACSYGVKKVIFPSILQAHHPQNVLEATKRIGEGYLQSLMTQDLEKREGRESRQTQFCVIRLENILGSNGSVAALLRDDLYHHKEITLTHLEMERSFITLRDASMFLLFAGAAQNQLSNASQSLWEIRTHPPLKIIELAQYLALLAGYAIGEKVKFQIKGLRPGEYILPSEQEAKRDLKETDFPGIYLCEQALYDEAILTKVLRELEEASSMGQTTHTLQLLHYLVPSFKPKTSSLNG